MPVTRHPPHRSRRAARPHRAPASGLTCWPPEGPAVRRRARVTGVTRPCVRSLGCSAGPVGRPLFQGCRGTLELSDSLHPCLTVVPRGCTVRAWRSLVRSAAGPPGFRPQGFCACQRSPTPPGLPTPRPRGGCSVACRVFGARRHPGLADCGAQYSAGTFPCQRFANAVTDACA